MFRPFLAHYQGAHNCTKEFNSNTYLYKAVEIVQLFYTIVRSLTMIGQKGPKHEGVVLL